MYVVVAGGAGIAWVGLSWGVGQALLSTRGPKLVCFFCFVAAWDRGASPNAVLVAGGAAIAALVAGGAAIAALVAGGAALVWVPRRIAARCQQFR